MFIEAQYITAESSNTTPTQPVQIPSCPAWLNTAAEQLDEAATALIVKFAVYNQFCDQIAEPVQAAANAIRLSALDLRRRAQFLNDHPDQTPSEK